MEKKSKRRLFAIFLVMGVLTLTGRAAAGPAQVGPRFEIFRGFSTENWAEEGPPSVAFDRANQRFLVVWTDLPPPLPGSDRGYKCVKGQLVNVNGSLYGNTLSISEPMPGVTCVTRGNSYTYKKIAFNPADQRFAIVWTDNRDGPERIYLQLVNADGSLNGHNLGISSADPHRTTACDPEMIYVPGNNNYFIVYQYLFGDALLGQFVTADGAVHGDPLTITTSPGAGSIYSNLSFCHPNISYDPASGRILIIWVDLYDAKVYGGDAKVYGRLLNADGSFFGPKLDLTPANTPVAPMDIVNDPDHGRFLMVLDSGSSWLGEWSQLITADGNLIGPSRLIFPDPAFNFYQSPALTFDQAHKNFLLTVKKGCDLYGQYLHTDGTLFGGVFTIAKTPGTGSGLALAFGTAQSGSLVVWNEGFMPATKTSSVYGVLVKAPPNFLPALLPLLLGD